MRIAWFDNAKEWGGVQVHLADLSRMVVAQGHSGSIVCDVALQSRYEIAMLGTGVEVVGFPCHRLSNPRAWLDLWNFLRKESPDVVHSHLYWATRLAAPVAKLAGVRMVVETLHLEEGWRKGWRQVLSYLDGAITEMFVDAQIAVSNAVAKSVLDIRRTSRDKMHVIHNTVPREEAVHEGRKSHHLAFLGRIEHQKGLDVLLEAVCVLSREGLVVDLVVGGDGSLRGEMERKSMALGVSKMVRFVGNVSNRAAFFSDRSILVLPSRFEGFPLVLLEAAWHHQCVVATAVSGTPELIEDGINGILCPSEDPRGLAEAIRRAVEGNELRERLSGNLTQTVSDRFSPDLFLRRTMEVIA